jgi:hypothetical protein
MELDQERAKSKREDLLKVVVDRLGVHVGDKNQSDLPAIANFIVDKCCKISAPEREEVAMELIVLRPGGGGGGRSRKPGNIALNMRKLVVALASSTLAISGIVANPLLAPLGALVLWDSIVSKMELDFQEREASVIWAMWLNRNERDHVAREGLLDLVNKERQTHGRAALSALELDDACLALSKIGCIKPAKGIESAWWLCEWIQVNFE